jgi:hypothetical protein
MLFGMPKEVAGAQRRRALGLANEVRLARRELKRRIAIGEMSAAEVLDAPQREAEGMSLWDLVKSQAGWGEARSALFLSHAQAALADAEIRRETTISSLTDAERSALVDLLTATAGPAAVWGKLADAVEDLRDSKVPGAPWRMPDTEWHDHVTLWDELASVGRRYEALSDELGHLAAERDDLIRALSRAGASRRAVARAASLTVGRVQQIVGTATTT